MSTETKADKSKGTTIIVNGRPKEGVGKEVSYDELVNLAYGDSPPTGEFVVITVTYSKGEDKKEGSLLPGNTVKTKDGMIFDVTATDKS